MLEPPRDTATEKTCSVCGEKKSVEEFYRDGYTSDGELKRRRDCKDCYRIGRLKRRNEM